MPDQDPDTLATFGKRLGVVEEDMGDLKVEMAKTTEGLIGVRHDMGILFSKLDRIAEDRGSVTATRGMIPITYVTWFITTLVAVCALGMTALVFAGGIMIYAMTSENEKDHLLIAENTHEIGDAERHQAVTDKWMMEHFKKVTELNATQSAHIEENQEELMEFKDWYHDFLEDYGKLSGKVDSLWSEISELKGRPH